MKKELMIFTAIFLFLAIGMHFKEWTSYPIEHLMALPNAGAYGFGAIHPFIFTLMGYLLFIAIRAISKLFSKKK
jgi:hypothetical protein